MNDLLVESEQDWDYKGEYNEDYHAILLKIRKNKFTKSINQIFM